MSGKAIVDWVMGAANVEGKDYPLAICNCHRCRNWVLYPDLPEFAPSYCAYCGLKFRWYEDGEGIERHLNGRAIGGNLS